MNANSEKIKIEQHLREQRSHQSFMAFAELADWLYFPNSNQLWISQRFREIHNLTTSAHKIELGDLSNCYPQDFSNLKDQLQNPVASPQQFTLHHADGRVFRVLIHPASDEEDNSVYGVHKEISIKKDRLNLLKNQKKLIDAISDAAICLDEEGRVIYWNKRAVETFGYQRQETMGKPVQDLNLGGHFQETDPKTMLSRLRQIKDQTFELLKDRSQAEVAVEISANALKDEYNSTIGIAAICRDISEIKEVRSQLIQSLGQMEMAIEGGKLGTWIHYLDTKQNLVNHHWAQMLGYSKSEVEEHFDFFQKHVHPEDKPKLQSLLESIERGESSEFEVKIRLRTKDGHWKWILDRGFVQEYDATGKPRVTAGIHLDIDERTRTEERNNFLSEIIRQSQHETYVFDLDTWKFVFVNPATEKALGYSAEELYSMTPLSIKPEYNFHTFQKLVYPLKSGATDKLQFTTKHQRKDGTRYDAEVILQKIVFGETEYFFAMVNDISERVMREEHVELLRSVVTNASDSIVITDGDYKPPGPRILYVNQAFTKMTGYAAEEVIGFSPRILQGPKTDTSSLKRLKQSLKNQKPAYAELINYTKSGDAYWVGLSMVPVYRDERVSNWVAIQRDISERIDRDLQMTNTILQEVEAERKNIAAELHDSLTQNLSAVSLILKNLPYDIPALKGLERFERAQNILQESINQSRDIAQKVMPKSIEDLGLIEALRELLEEYDKATDIDFSLKYNSDGRTSQETELAMYRIVQEALKNIVKHAQATEATIDLNFEPEAFSLKVSDNGVGLKLEDQNYFEGIGLRTMRHRVIKLGGVFNIDSAKNKGTTLTAVIPYKDEH